MAARKAWDLKPVADRAQIFLKAADLLSGPHRAEVLAKTMVGQVRRLWAQWGWGGRQPYPIHSADISSWVPRPALLAGDQEVLRGQGRAEGTSISCETTYKVDCAKPVSYHGNVPSPPSLSPP